MNALDRLFYSGKVATRNTAYRWRHKTFLSLKYERNKFSVCKTNLYEYMPNQNKLRFFVMLSA